MRGATLTLAAAALAAGAQAQEWVSIGPPGGDVRSLAADPRDPRVVYLGTATSHLYRSEDAGRSWRRVAPGFPLRGMALDDLRVLPDGRVLVGYWEVSGTGGGVALSEDGGASFEVLTGMLDRPVRGLAFAPSDPRSFVAGTPTGVFLSRDSGASWERVSPEGHPGLRNVGSVAFDPRDADVIYAGTWHLPWKTEDAGRSWKRVHAGMIDDSDVMTLSFDPRDPRRVYATACSGIYRSPNAGAAWGRIPGIPWSARRTRAFAQDPERPETLYAGTTQGLWLSEDGAGSWRLATEPTLVVNAVLPLPDGVVLAGSDGAGLLRSEDGGRSFAASNDGFTERFVAGVVFDGTRVLAGVAGDRTHGGVFAAEAFRGPWRRLGMGLEGRELLTLAASPAAILAGTDDGVFRLTRGDDRWQRLKTEVDGRDVHPRVRDLATLGEAVLLAATSEGLLGSDDGGAAWGRRELSLGGAATAVAADPESGLALAATALGVFRSADAGASWERVASGPQATITSLLVVPGEPPAAYATSSRGVYRSTDAGRSWVPLHRGLPAGAVTGLTAAADGRTLYACDFTYGGLYWSTDRGASWEPFPTQGLAVDRVWTLATDARGRLLASAAAGGLHLWLPPTAALGTADGGP